MLSDVPVTCRKPPPEKPAEVRRRSLVVLSFWLIVFCLGLPIWWKTTAIYRAPLPLETMLRWADGKACRPVFPLQIVVQPGSLQDNEAQTLVRLTQLALDDLNEFSGHHLRLQLDRRPDNDDGGGGGSKQDDATIFPVALTIRLGASTTNSAVLDPHSAVLDVTYGPNSLPAAQSSSSSVLASFLADQLRSIFAEEQALIAHLLSTQDLPAGSSAAASQVEPASAGSAAAASGSGSDGPLAKRTTRSMRYAPVYHLTFSLFTSGASPNAWEIDAAVAEYVQPVLDVLGPLHDFSIDTQVQLYSLPGTQARVLGRDDVASFINAAEWPLSPSIGAAPTINFVVFVGNQTVDPDRSVAHGDGNGQDEAGGDPAETSRSWLIAQWGSVYLLPSAAGGAETVSAQALREPMLTFAGHLLSLLGMPQSSSLPMRLATLSRVRSADVMLRAASTLGALARLARALPSISIPGSVADGVSRALAHLELACGSLGGPQGLAHARVAEQAAEKAFFEKSMVGQLYFPDEHKIAVYLPLLGPVGVPLVMGLFNELRGWWRRWKEREREKEREKEKEKEKEQERASEAEREMQHRE